MEPGTNACIQRHFYGIKVVLRGLVSASRLNLMERVVVRSRSQHPRLANAQALNEHRIFGSCPYPGCRLDGSAAVITLKRARERSPVRGTIDKKLCLSDGPRIGGETAKEIINLQALLSLKRQAPPLGLAMGCLPGPS